MPKLQLSWMCALVLALVLAAGAVAQPTQPGYVRLARVTGEVSVEARGGERRPAREVTEIAQGYIVRTAADSSVILVFSNGSTINLGPNSVLDIEEFLQDPFGEDLRPSEMTAEPTISRTKLNLTQGELVGNVKTLRKDEGSSFTVQTPVGAAGIRGTTFRIVFRPDGTGRAFFSLTTLEGEVGFATLTGTVDDPQAIVADTQEVTVEVDINEQTGEVTVLTPVAEIAAQTASTGTIAEIAAAVQQVAEAVADLVLTPQSGTGQGGAGDGGGGGSEEGEESEGDDGEGGGDTGTDGEAPPVIGRNFPDLTSGDGS